MVSPLGYGVLACGVACWLFAWRLGWDQLFIMAAVSIALWVACGVLTIGRASLRVDVTLAPRRIVVGGSCVGTLTVTNPAKRLTLPVAVELPIGDSAVRIMTPLLVRGASSQELFVVAGERRGVIPVGPARVVRGDPLGLFRREAAATETSELFVHPRTVALESLGAGLFRDLEGRSTFDISPSDLAFHTLREYQPGDDQRHIHWRSSARAVSPGKFFVRQFVDTRRTHVCVMVDTRPGSYRTSDELEDAISVAASISLRTIRDEQDASIVIGGQAMTGGSGQLLLDTCARAELRPETMADLAKRAIRLTSEASSAVVITGALAPLDDLLLAASTFPVEVQAAGLRLNPDERTNVTWAGSVLMLTLRNLHELPSLIGGTLR
jgi:uncharacterized protein (DUF58 family)